MGAASHPPRSGLVQCLGFNLNASTERSVMATKIGRIRVKSQWTKALGEVSTVAYGDCNRNVEVKGRCGVVSSKMMGGMGCSC